MAYKETCTLLPTSENAGRCFSIRKFIKKKLLLDCWRNKIKQFNVFV